MALYGGARDISMFRHINRELMGNIISQQCIYYKFDLGETKVNIYGEASGGKYYHPPVALNCLVERSNQSYPESDLGINFAWGITFKFLREDLKDASVVPQVGDIILYYNGYYEVESTNANQYILGKNPDYPYNENPLNPGLEQFGANYSIICNTVYIPGDKPGITKERL